jgi:serine hydrolase
MQQVFVIHGGDSFATYEEYLENLKNWRLDLERLRGGWDWKGHLQEQLGTEYDVFTPSMPNKRNAKYIEWKIWFEKFVPFMSGEPIFIGHSLGAVFSAKYFAENDLNIPIKATFLIAGLYGEADFPMPTNLSRLTKQGGKLFLYQSKDDPVVSFGELAKYQAALPKATARVFEDRGHFNQEQFPELVADIKAL